MAVFRGLRRVDCLRRHSPPDSSGKVGLVCRSLVLLLRDRGSGLLLRRGSRPHGVHRRHERGCVGARGFQGDRPPAPLVAAGAGALFRPTGWGDSGSPRRDPTATPPCPPGACLASWKSPSAPHWPRRHPTSPYRFRCTASLAGARSPWSATKDSPAGEKRAGLPSHGAGRGTPFGRAGGWRSFPVVGGLSDFTLGSVSPRSACPGRDRPVRARRFHPCRTGPIR